MPGQRSSAYVTAALLLPLLCHTAVPADCNATASSPAITGERRHASQLTVLCVASGTQHLWRVHPSSGNPSAAVATVAVSAAPVVAACSCPGCSGSRASAHGRPRRRRSRDARVCAVGAGRGRAPAGRARAAGAGARAGRRARGHALGARRRRRSGRIAACGCPSRRACCCRVARAGRPARERRSCARTGACGAARTRRAGGAAAAAAGGALAAAAADRVRDAGAAKRAAAGQADVLVGHRDGGLPGGGLRDGGRARRQHLGHLWRHARQDAQRGHRCAARAHARPGRGVPPERPARAGRAQPWVRLCHSRVC